MSPTPATAARSQRNAEMWQLNAEGVTLAEIGRRYGVTYQRVAQVIRAEMARRRFRCDLQTCSEKRRHSHCRACGLVVAEGAPICELCQREAHRALLIATGHPVEASRLHTVAGDDHLAARVLGVLNDDPEEVA